MERGKKEPEVRVPGRRKLDNERGAVLRNRFGSTRGKKKANIGYPQGPGHAQMHAYRTSPLWPAAWTPKCQTKGAPEKKERENKK